MSKQNKNYQKHYFVHGMHCSSCEVLLSQDIGSISGVHKADVSLKYSKIIIHAQSRKHIPSINALNEMFSELGYTFHENEIKNKPVQKNDMLKIMAVSLAFIFFFYIFERSNLLGRISINSQSSFAMFFIFGLAAGVSSCAALVGGLLLSLSKKWNEIYGSDSKSRFIPFIYFNASRVITFAILGGFLGLLGSFFKLSIPLMAFFAILVSILMVVIGLQMLGVSWFKNISFNFFGNNDYLNKNKNIEGKYVPIIVGASTFLIPCGFTIIAQTTALTAGSFYLGFMQLFFFALGTLPVLALISFSSVRFYSNPSFSKKFAIFSGTLIIFFGLSTLNSQLNVLGFKSLNDIRFQNNSDDESSVIENSNETQVMEMEVKGFEYFPKEITIKSGLKTTWNIKDNDAFGCAKAVYARGLYKDVIYLKSELTSVTFTAPKKGTYKVSCSMGMVAPITVKVL